MDESVRLRLLDMVGYAGKAIRILEDRSAEALSQDEIRSLAVTHAVQIVGEAARKVPDDVRERVPSVAWRASVAMRNIIVHDYGDVDYEILVQTVRYDFPALVSDLKRLLGEDNT